LIIAKPFEAIPVIKLHFLEFANPLIATMSGDEAAASQLFDSRVLDCAKQKFAQVNAKPLAISDKVLIRREKNLFRPLINGDKVQEVLEEKYGFHTVYLGDKNLSEVMGTFRNTSVVVGEYGAGLANMLFIKNGSLVIEIRGGLEKDADEYRALGKVLGHDYEIVHGVNRKISKFGVSRGPYTIDIEKVIEILESNFLAINDEPSR
jgi:capsular polysaccharide biosynthesis protein